MAPRWVGWPSYSRCLACEETSWCGAPGPTRDTVLLWGVSAHLSEHHPPGFCLERPFHTCLVPCAFIISTPSLFPLPDQSQVQSLPRYPWWLKESACNAGDLGLIAGLGRYLAEENGNPLQYSCLENSMERGAWRATVHRVA